MMVSDFFWERVRFHRYWYFQALIFSPLTFDFLSPELF